MKRIFNKSYSAIYILKYKNHFQKDLLYFWHRKLTLKIEFLQFLEGQKELEEVFIKNIFEYNLSIGKCLLTISWSELGITTVDTLVDTPLRYHTKNMFCVVFHSGNIYNIFWNTVLYCSIQYSQCFYNVNQCINWCTIKKI